MYKQYTCTKHVQKNMIVMIVDNVISIKSAFFSNTILGVS